jgi:hypothetical protein
MLSHLSDKPIVGECICDLALMDKEHSDLWAATTCV